MSLSALLGGIEEVGVLTLMLQATPPHRHMQYLVLSDSANSTTIVAGANALSLYIAIVKVLSR